MHVIVLARDWRSNVRDFRGILGNNFGAGEPYRIFPNLALIETSVEYNMYWSLVENSAKMPVYSKQHKGIPLAEITTVGYNTNNQYLCGNKLHLKRNNNYHMLIRGYGNLPHKFIIFEVKSETSLRGVNWARNLMSIPFALTDTS